jgi:hypothetical protein
MSRFSPIHLALICIIAWSFLPVVARLGQSQLDSFQFLFLDQSTLSRCRWVNSKLAPIAPYQAC